MKRWAAPLAVILAMAPVLSRGDDINATARAKAAGDTAKLGQGSSVFTTGTVQTTVTPYEGTNVGQTSINGSNIGDRTSTEVMSGSDASRALADVNDSVALRPKYDLDASYVGITVGDEATVNAEDIAGQYFTTSGTQSNPACNFDNLSILPEFKRYCDVAANLVEKDCTIRREVTVERTDVWQCMRSRDLVATVCTTKQNGNCAAKDLPTSKPNLQCTEVSNSCLEHEIITKREPASGARYESCRGKDCSGYNYAFHYASFGSHGNGNRTEVWWNGAMVFSGLGSWHSWVKVGNCTYYQTKIGTSQDTIHDAVYRICESEGRCLKRKFEHYCISSNECAALESENACVADEAVCLNYDGYGCRQEQVNFTCQNIGDEFSGATLTTSRIDRISDVLVNDCNPAPESQGCIASGSECTAGAEVRVVNGFPVSRECWEYKQSYQCAGDGSKNYTDCAPFKSDSSCRVTNETCLSFAESEETAGATPAECVHWEYEYTCGGSYEIPDSCSAFNVCVGDLCEGYSDEPNTDFANASAWLTVLDEAAKDSEKSIDSGSVTLFSGTARKCKVGALGTINCCKDSGWANDILADCSEGELALMDRIQAKAAVYVGTYCSRKVLGVCLQRKRSYCTFNSQLGMVFQKEIRRLAGTGWGSAKNPNCEGLALEDINTINWDKIDLSEAFTDMLNDASVPTSAMVTDYLRDRLSLTAGSLSEGD